jgi:hypothetical protein
MDYGKLNSHAWDERISAPMGPGEAAAFQEKLDGVAGVEPDGTKRLRLVWAPDYEEWNVHLKKMTPSMWALWRAKPDGLKPKAEGSAILEPQWEYVVVPRYALLGRVTPASRAGDTRDRTFFEADGTSVEELEQPHAWRKVMWIWRHTEVMDGDMPMCCLTRAHVNKTRCFGDFRKPDDYDLQFIQRLFSQWNAQFQTLPHERLGDEDKHRLIGSTNDFYARRQAGVDSEAAYISRAEDNNDWYKRPNDSVKGKFSLPEG